MIKIIISRIRKLIGIKKIYSKSTREKNLEKLIIYKNITNFSRLNIPFSFNMIIRPIYDDINHLKYLMGISYHDNDEPCAKQFYPISWTYTDLESELDNLPFSIVLTSSCIPYHILYVNKKWQETTRYNKIDVIGRTFSMLQGKSGQNKHEAHQFREKIRLILILDA